MKEIPLTKGRVALVDDEDFIEISKHKWYANHDTHTIYAQRTPTIEGKQITIRMHRYILNAPYGQKVDHKDGNGLNNQRNNLRLCSNSQNGQNCRLRKDNKSGYKGVYWDSEVNKWASSLGFKNKTIRIGRFTCLIKAAKAYDKKATELYGEFAVLNFPEAINADN